MASKLKTISSVFSVDCVIFGFDDKELKLLLIERGEQPHMGEQAIPGDFVRMDEDIDHSARRVLAELTGLKDVFMEQFHTFGEVDRHPWGRIITVAYYALIKLDEQQLKPSSFARNAVWKPVKEVPKLAFDHNRIIDMAQEHLRATLRYKPIGFELLPPKFTLTELQHIYEAVLDRTMDKRNFRRKIMHTDLICPLDEKQKGVPHKAARLFRFDKRRYNQLRKKGFSFEI